MSDTADSLTSKETQDAPGYDVSSPPPPPPPLSYSSEGQQPPPYSAALAMCPPPKIETTCTYQPTTGYDSFPDVSPKASSDTTPLKSSSSFDDKTVRRTFIRKVFSILAVQLLFTFSVMCVFTFSEVEEIQTGMCLSSFIIFIVAATALSCCKSFSRRHPWNTVGLPPDRGQNRGDTGTRSETIKFLAAEPRYFTRHGKPLLVWRSCSIYFCTNGHFTFTRYSQS